MKTLDFARYAVSIGVASAILAACGAGNSAVPAISVGAAVFAHQKTFKYTGSAQTFTVPKGVKQIKVEALGGNGGSLDYGEFRSGRGGYGARIVATLDVTPRERFVVYVGGNGSGSTGAFNGGAAGGSGVDSGSSTNGGGGGGASDLRAGYGKLAERILVAGGGGGGGGNYSDRYEQPFGGKGGGVSGGSGGGTPRCHPLCGGGGSGGTQSSGGSGGETGLGGGCNSGDRKLCGGDGSQGVGGAGGNGAGEGSGYLTAGGGGGGGGGYYGGGGGGGGGQAKREGAGGGGGGGSSYVEPGASGVKIWKGWKARQRVVVISW